MRTLCIGMTVVLLGTLVASAFPVTLFSDTDTFVRRAKEIVIAKCVGPVPTLGEEYQDGIYPVTVDVVAVVKGKRALGRATIVTQHPLKQGNTYLLTSLGGKAYGTDFLAIPQLAVVEVPRNFRRDGLEGLDMKTVVQSVFDARYKEIAVELRTLENERMLLERAIAK